MNNSSALTFGGILGNLISVVGGGQTQQQFSQPSGHGPVKVSNLGYHDDFKFCRHFQDKNILITGATGTIGSALVETLLKNCVPRTVGLFCRDDGTLSTDIQSLCNVPTNSTEKRVYSYEVDFVDPIKLTAKVH